MRRGAVPRPMRPSRAARRRATARSSSASPPRSPPPPPPPGAAKVGAAAGDIVCDPTGSGYAGANPSVCQHRATADLLAGADAVLPLGDLQDENGTLDQLSVAS